MNIKDYIPEGYENRASLGDIARWSNISKRAVRQAINRANNQDALIINLGSVDGFEGGYFIPTIDELELAYIYIASEQKRAYEIEIKTSKMQKSIGAIYG